MSAVVYLPRDRYTTNVRLRIEHELRETFQAVSIDYEARMTESALARLFFRIRLPKGADVSHVNAEELEKRLVRAARSWSEGIAEVLRDAARRRRPRNWPPSGPRPFPASYRVDYEVEDALEDIARFEKYGAAAERTAGARQERPGVHVYLPEGAGATLEEDARVKLYMLEPKSLSQILPYFHNLGLEVLDERPFEIETADSRDFFLYDLGLKYPAGWIRCQPGSCWPIPSARQSPVRQNRTASTGWCCVKACSGARSLFCGPMRDTCGRWATPTRSGSSPTPCWPIRQ